MLTRTLQHRATFDTGTLTFYESKKSATPLAQFVLPSASVLVEPQPKEKLEMYVRCTYPVPACLPQTHFVYIAHCWSQVVAVIICSSACIIP